MDERALVKEKKTPDKIEGRFIQIPVRHHLTNLGSLTLYPESNNPKIDICRFQHNWLRFHLRNGFRDPNPEPVVGVGSGAALVLIQLSI